MSPNLRRAVITAEDGRFCEHKGVDWEAINQVVEQAADGKPLRGASTISMQVSKNLFLWSQRSFIRKGLEVPITYYLEFIWPKHRMLEVYLNIAEWGEGIYGAEAAARHYFGQSAASLSSYQAAMLAASLPNPKLQNPNRQTPAYQARLARIQRHLARGGASTACL
jgi:monofunctional biosynthetic peptidoglycan transglycosylase